MFPAPMSEQNTWIYVFDSLCHHREDFEVDTALKIAELVGKDNLIVKVHPRDRSGKFESSGLNIDRNSSVPWESIQLNYDFSDHVFLTISSNSVFGVNVMMKKQAKVFFLYNTLDTKKNSLIHSSVEAIKNIMQYKDQIDLKNYLVVDEIKEILGWIVKKNI